MISNYAVGVDNVDVAAATARGIPVGHTPDVLTDSTADLAVALMLAIARRIPEGERIVRAGRWGTWGPTWMLGRDLHGATVAIVGGGRIGLAVARRLEGFGCEVVVAGRGEGELAGALEVADFVTLHTPLTPETRGLIGEAQLRAMKPTAYWSTPRAGRSSTRGARAGAARGLDRGRGARCHGSRAAAGRPSDPRRAEPPRHPPPRLGHPPDPRGDGRPRRRQPAGRPGRRTTAPLREPRGVRGLAAEALLAQLGEGALGLLDLDAHPGEHGRGLRELDVAVVDDLEAVAPGIAEVEAAPGEDLDAGRLERPRGRPPCRRRPARSGGARPAPASASSAIAMNWSPISRNAIPRIRPRSSNSNSRP